MSTVRELYEDSLLSEEPVLAYCILYLVQEDKLSFEDDASVLDSNKLQLTPGDQEKIAWMIEENKLGFDGIKIFSLKYDAKRFAFVFARNEKEAIEFFHKRFRRKPYNCYQYPLDFPMSRGREFITFRDMKKEHSRFPALAGFYERSDLYGSFQRKR